MTEETPICSGCGAVQVLAPGIEYYCPNKACDYDQRRAKAFYRKFREDSERAEYERLKAKFGKEPNQ